MHTHMDQGSVSFTQAVISIWVDHVVKRFSQRDEAVDQAFDDLNMRVGLAGSSHDQQFAFETFSKVDGCRSFISFRVDFPRPQKIS